MDPLVQYTIPLKGLLDGFHQYEFSIDGEFFQQFEHSPVAEGRIDLDVHLDKRPDMCVVQFDLKGTVRTECDRCLAAIDLPVVDSQQLLVKFSEKVENHDPDIIYLDPEATNISLAHHIYEYICLAIPIIKVYNCEQEETRVCDDEMLQRLEDTEKAKEAEENPIWDELKNLVKKNNQ